MKIKYLAALTFFNSALIFFNFALLQSSERLNQDLINAINDGQLETVRCLVERGANVNAKDDNDWTALMYAARYGHPEIFSYLAEHGADVNTKDYDGCTASMYAARYGHPEIFSYLVEHGANVNAKDYNGWTALMHAAFNGHAETVKYLTEQRADVNAKANCEWTVLMCAADNGHTETVKYLAERGADFNVKDKNGYTALMYAANNGHTQTVKYLVENDANVNVKNRNNHTALNGATRSGHRDVVKYLIEHGADTTTIDELIALAREEQEYYGRYGGNCVRYKTVHDYLVKISFLQQYLKDALVKQQITQEPSLAQYSRDCLQCNRLSSKTKLLSENETREKQRDDEKETTEEEFANMIERFMTDQSAYWKNRLREAIIPLQEPQNEHHLRNFLTEINPGLLPQIISYFNSKEIFRNLITEELLPTATEPQRTRLHQILQTEERVESDIQNRTQDHGQAEREAIAQKIRDEMAHK